MKEGLAIKIKALMHENIQLQGKEMVIAETVRMVFFEKTSLAITMHPILRASARFALNAGITSKLMLRYAQYKGEFVTIGDIVTDLLYELKEHGISIHPCYQEDPK